MNKTCPTKDRDSSQEFADDARSSPSLVCTGNGATLQSADDTQRALAHHGVENTSWKPKS